MVFRWLLLLIPISLALRYFFDVPPLLVFGAAILAIVPLAEWIRRATEQLADKLGSTIGGLLNVTFGNVAEMLLAVFVLLGGETTVVKGQITGSIIGNSLLGLGLCIVIGSWGREKQTFNKDSAGKLSSLLILSVIALLLPALFNYTERGFANAATASALNEKLSLGVSIVLIVVYLANLVYTLVTHRDVFQSACKEKSESEEREEKEEKHWSVWTAIGVLVVCTALTAWEAEVISGELGAAANSLGLTKFFLGVIVLAIIGNAAEYVAAISFARQDKMTTVMGIMVGSSIQVALLIAPLLVLISYFIGSPMNLVFANPLELIAIAAVAFIVNSIALDGETTWFEGVMLIAVYVILAMAFLFVTP
ncbi:MAG: calcium/proton exchanger [Acidobacteriota bacterium]|nr:calcium/proton exchanger [Acidobacteriota bacterium]